MKPGPLHQVPLPAELESLNSHDLEKLEKGLVHRLASCLFLAVGILVFDEYSRPVGISFVVLLHYAGSNDT